MNFLQTAKCRVGFCKRTFKLIGRTAQMGTKSEMMYKIQQPYKYFKLQANLPTTVPLTGEDALKMYYSMLVMRKMENMAADLYKQKVIRGFCHLYAGQEAIATGLRLSVRDKDSVVTAYRCHAWLWAMGTSVVGVLGELAGRVAGCSRGKGGSMHMFGKRMLGGHGIVGSQVPIGTGVSLYHKYSGDGGVSFTLYGDGAANQGQVFEAMNMAKLLHLPIIYICENNLFGLGTAAQRSSASTAYYTRGDYIPGVWANGMDVVACREVGKFALDYVLKGNGPIIVECDTYRYFGHSMSDPGTSYRTRQDVASVRDSRDPIKTFKQIILEGKITTPQQIKEIDKQVQNEINKAVQDVLASPEPPGDELTADVYKKCIYDDNLIRGNHPHDPLKHISLGK